MDDRFVVRLIAHVADAAPRVDRSRWDGATT
jgi:hypothetical protein